MALGPDECDACGSPLRAQRESPLLLPGYVCQVPKDPKYPNAEYLQVPYEES